ncbi:MAG TPA: nuclear transport factor 2 family protein [Dictyobacter sp.]|nr:nuclear transport factor 2 family protein [Dictyobacter sp.]
MSELEQQEIALQPPVSSWIAAFNAHDVAALVALYTNDAELSDSGMKHPRCGRQEIERWFSQRFQTMPSIAYVPSGVFLQQLDDAHAGPAMVTWTVHGQTPRFFGLSWLSHPFQVAGVSVFTLRNGLIAQQHGYYDHLAVVERVITPLRWFPTRL